MRKLTDVVLDLGENLGKSTIRSEVRGKNAFQLFWETSAQLVLVDLAGSVLFFIFYDQSRARFTKEFYDFEPVVKIGVVLAGVSDEKIERSLGEEKLMGCMVDFLSPEVPDVDAEVIAAGMEEIETENINAFSGFFGSVSTF